MKSIPMFRGKTALGLLKAVKAAILDEPKRIHMGVFSAKRDPRAHANTPPCGTVGCFAGWVSILGGQGLVDDDEPARRLLGRNLNYNTVETVEPAESVFNSGHGDSCQYTRQGTRDHAHAVVARIDRFIEKNKKALRRRRLPNLSTRRRYAKGFEYRQPGGEI